MLLIADANIPHAEEALRPYGEVRLLPGRSMTAEQVRDADFLLVRSVTKVQRELLEGSRVRFVGTATIGTDHLDIPWLDGAGIAWTSAQGCNAISVVEWVLAAVLEWAVPRGRSLAGLKLGIVGHGNIGSRLAPRARALGMEVLVNDPPLQEAGRGAGFVSLQEVLQQADVITFHVPNIREGRHRTHHLAGAAELDVLRGREVLLLNASRGNVVDNAAALRVLAEEPSVAATLDVFEGEPRPNRALVQRCLHATPHIAGYSYEGKVNGTRMIADAVARFLGVAPAWQPTWPAVPHPEIVLPAVASAEEGLLHAIRTSYDLRRDDAALRGGLGAPTEEAWGAHFDDLRKRYPVRREFANYRLQRAAPEAVKRLAIAAGFHEAP